MFWPMVISMLVNLDIVIFAVNFALDVDLDTIQDNIFY